MVQVGSAPERDGFHPLPLDRGADVRVELSRPMMDVVHRRMYGETVDDAMVDRCATAFAEATTKLAHRMEGREWLVGDAMSGADITAAAVMFRVRAAELFPFPELLGDSVLK